MRQEVFRPRFAVPKGRARVTACRTMKPRSPRCSLARRNARRGAPLRTLRRDRGEELGWRTGGAGQKIVAVEHFVRGDRFDFDGCCAEVEDRDAILSARAATEPDDET